MEHVVFSYRTAPIPNTERMEYLQFTIKKTTKYTIHGCHGYEKLGSNSSKQKIANLLTQQGTPIHFLNSVASRRPKTFLSLRNLFTGRFHSCHCTIRWRYDVCDLFLSDFFSGEDVLFSIAPENWWLEDEMSYFQGRTVSFRESIYRWEKLQPLGRACSIPQMSTCNFWYLKVLDLEFGNKEL